MRAIDEIEVPPAPSCGLVSEPAPATEEIFDVQAWGGRSLDELGVGGVDRGGSGSSWEIPAVCADLSSAAALLGARYRVGKVFQAGLSDQVSRLQRFLPHTARVAGAEALDLEALLRAVGWRAWCPATEAPMWRWLWRSFERFEAVFGEVPPIEEVGFYHQHYRVEVAPDGVRVRPVDETLAMFGGGSMAVYRNAEARAGGKPVPGARSARSREAPLMALAPADGFAFFIVHELAHGLVERTKGGLHRLEEFRLFAGWAPDGRLYDAGSTSVEVIGRQLRLPADRRIGPGNWNAGWEEQPVTQYAATHAVEDFAESAAAFVLCPKLLELRAPRRFSFFAQSFG